MGGQERAELEGGGASNTHRVKGTTPAAADWMKPPQTVELLSDQQGAGPVRTNIKKGAGSSCSVLQSTSCFLSL